MTQIILKDLCLDYIVQTGSHSLKQSLFQAVKRPLSRQKSARPMRIKNSHYRALNQINLTLNTGDKIGILGQNGAGKSSLLKVLAKIYAPTQGTATVIGSISSLFDLHLGMNPEATGFENIINLGVMRGLTMRAARDLFEDIAAFTELGDFLDQPVRTYSAGMTMKLAFAVATAQAADIMLIDEVIGVGDAHFMEKATQRLSSRLSQSDILVLTSHTNETLQRFCTHGVILDQGHNVFFGPIEEAIARYQQIKPPQQPR